jgi:hypothetical protein
VTCLKPHSLWLIMVNNWKQVVTARKRPVKSVKSGLFIRRWAYSADSLCSGTEEQPRHTAVTQRPGQRALEGRLTPGTRRDVLGLEGQAGPRCVQKRPKSFPGGITMLGFKGVKWAYQNGVSYTEKKFKRQFGPILKTNLSIFNYV